MIHRAFVRCCMVFAFLGALFLAGCGKSDASSTTAAQPASPSTIHPPPSTNPAPILRFHWLGKKKVAAESSATNFMAIWNLPESGKLEAQTLDKLATAPWRLFPAATPLSNAPIASLRLLLGDLVQEESYLEVRAATNQLTQLVFAIRQDDQQAALWKTNLALVMASLTGVKPVALSDGWSVRKHETPDFWQFTRTSGWTLLAASTGDANPLLKDIRSRLQREHLPFAAAPTNNWLEADLPAVVLHRLLGVTVAEADLPTLHFTVAGEAGGVRWRGTAAFPHALPPVFAEPWQIPTNIIHDPLGAFTAVRGLDAFSSAKPFLLTLASGRLPNQFFSWAIAGSPFETFFALPATDASNRVSQLCDLILASGSSFFATNGTTLTRMTNANGLLWGNLPFLQPWLQSVDLPAGSFISSGYVPSLRTNRPAPPELLAQLRANTNLVYYDWEFTGARIEAWVFLGQTLRLSFNKAQLPPGSAAGQWIQVLIPRLGNTVTGISLDGERQLTFTRKGDLGLTGMEVHLLADWLEAPNFPAGWHTLDVEPLRPTKVRRR
jgi:hypothetical protein